jgi:hypothetical protein
MAELIIAERQDIVAIANAIRNKAETTKELTLNEMITAINGIGVGIDTSDATAEASEILNGETAYVNGKKITGTFTIDNELTTQDDLINQITVSLKNKATGNVNIDEELSIQDDLIAQIQIALNNKINGNK